MPSTCTAFSFPQTARRISGPPRFRGGAIVSKGKVTPLPSDPELDSARFRQDGGADLVLTNKEGTMTWNPNTGARAVVGGISPRDGANYAGDLAGGVGIVLFYTATAVERKAIRELEYLEQTKP